jgi:flavin reductase (DIM6/NTAB) family NADH-FMN oxidoreductase RutF
MSMKDDWSLYSSEFNGRMNSPGVFLTVSAGGRANTMTIGWGAAGVFWTKPALVVPVRFSRFTREILEQSSHFTVSIPKAGELLDALAFCGAKSGRDADKFSACGLTAKPGRSVPAPVVGEAWMHIECRVLYRTDMGKLNFDAETDARFYRDHNYHTLYFGEVVDRYET